MKMLFLGACVARHDTDYLINNERYTVNHAAQKVCWHFIDGLDAANGVPADLLCTMRVSSYPGFKKLVAFRLQAWDRGQGASGRYIPYLNLPGLRYPSTIVSALACVLAWTWRNRKEKQRCMVVYAMYTPCILPVLFAAKVTGSRSVMIISDLPEFTGPMVQRGLPALLRKLNATIAHWIASRYDGLILFSRNMVERLDVSRLQWEVIEGCVGLPPTEPPVSRPDPAVHSVMYSGVLSAAYGVKNLLDAFRGLDDPKAQLWLCGEGELKQEIMELAATDPRVIYYGTLPNPEVVDRQRRATLLINPRNGKHAFTRYSFPSKNLEYMTSGRPILLCRMDGIPSEYYDYLYVIEGDTHEAIRKKLAEVLNLPEAERTAVGARARNFVFKQKNYRCQGIKIRQLIGRII